jgi:hypothetical protein
MLWFWNAGRTRSTLSRSPISCTLVYQPGNPVAATPSAELIDTSHSFVFCVIMDDVFEVFARATACLEPSLVVESQNTSGAG